MRFHLLHRWSRWSEPTEHQMIYIGGGRREPFVERRQHRTCQTCGAIQEREV